MTEHIKRQWKRLSAAGRWLLSISFVCIALTIIFAADTDNDGMSDAYELLFGLNPASDDSQQDPDTDDLVNYSEYLKWTDPFAADTDLDNWNDAADSNPVSRAFFDFGNAQFTSNDYHQYTAPDWWVAAYKTDGAWLTNAPTAWYIDASASNGVGSLTIEVDRTLLTNDAVLNITLLGNTNSALYVNLCDSNDTVIATNLYGNLITDANATNTLTLDIPFETYSNAVSIKLRRETGAIHVYDGLLFIDSDGDDLDREQEQQLGTSDADLDSDNDDLGDYTEAFGDTDPTNPDTDNDGMNDGNEVYHGANALVSNSYAQLPFTENFETNTVAIGPLHNQNNWLVAPTNTATVQTQTVYAGTQAMALDAGTADSATVKHLFAAPAGSVVWADWRTIATFSSDQPTNPADFAATMYFNTTGQLVVYNGTTDTWCALSNHAPVVESAWVRLTVKLDYSAQTWLLCLNDFIIAEDLGFGAETAQFSSFSMEGTRGHADNLNISTTQPSGVVSNWNTMPDSWELQYFGNLYQTDVGDYDADGLSNLAEYQNGANPTISDTDNDGMNDDNEVYHGANALVSNSYAQLPFTEYFETNTVNVGLLHNQNAWLVSPTNTATVQTNKVYAGAQAMDLDAGTSVATVTHLFAAPTGTVVWADWHAFARLSVTPTNAVDTAAAMYFNDDCRLVVYDGATEAWCTLSNHLPVVEDSWVRLTVKLNYSAQTWMVCLEDYILAENLGFGAAAVEFSSFAMNGAKGYADNMNIGATEPSGVVSNWNTMPDSWELQYIGHLYETDIGDYDGDGLSNLAEYQNGTDPTVTDTDDDGLLDGLEINTWSSDPLSKDTDNDGLLDGEEVATFYLDPAAADSDDDGTNDMYLVAGQTADGTNVCHKEGTWKKSITWIDSADYYTNVQSWAESGSTLYATNVARVEYEFTAPAADMYRFGFKHINYGATMPQGYQYHLLFLVDHVRVATLDIDAVSGTSTWEYVTTPWLSATSHNFRLVWVNWTEDSDTVFGLEETGLFAVDGPDTNANARQDWVDDLLAQINDLDQDGLTDLAEIDTHGTDPLNADTDGDHLLDGEELSLFNTAPLLADSDTNGVNDAIVIIEQNGTAAVERISGDWDWWDVDSSVVNKQKNAPISYAVNIATGSMYRIGLQLRNWHSEIPDDWKFQVEVSINGFYVDTMEIFADNDFSGIGYINTPWLTATNHTITFEWVNSAWIFDPNKRAPNIQIEKVRLYQVDAPDANTNGYQDWVETLFSEGGDTDGDGLTDTDEVNTYCTDPLNMDTDGDWLTDKEEVDLGTDPLDIDSDNDGVTDGEEVEESLTDPLVAQFDGTVTDVDVVYGSETNVAVGDWLVEGTEIVAQRGRGYVEYTLTAPTSDVYRIIIEATHDWLKKTCSPVSPVDSSDLMLYMDDAYLGKRTLVAPDGIYGDIRMFTPMIGSGDHTVRVFWENVHTRISLRIKQLKLQSLGGADSNTNGVKDWTEESIGNMTDLTTAMLATNGAGAMVSAVSPACLEGAARYVDAMTCAIGTNSVTVHPGVGERWYADIPLSSTGATEFTVNFQDDAVSITTNILWTALNVLDDNDFTVRKDDTLMLTAAPDGATNGAVTIQVSQGANVLTNVVTDLDTPVTWLFDQAGAYTVSGAFSNQTVNTNESILVTVMAAAFPTSAPAFLLGKKRTWSCPDIPTNAVLEVDATVDLVHSGGTIEITMNKVNKRHTILARLSEDGPILAGSPLNPLWVQAAVDSYMWLIEKYEDGSELWENRMIVKNLPPDVDIKIITIVSGVTFEDQTTVKWLTSEDIDEIGEYIFRMIKPESVTSSTCHRILLYQDGVYLGEAYYAGVLMPDE